MSTQAASASATGQAYDQAEKGGTAVAYDQAEKGEASKAKAYNQVKKGKAYYYQVKRGGKAYDHAEKGKAGGKAYDHAEKGEASKAHDQPLAARGKATDLVKKGAGGWPTAMLRRRRARPRTW